MESYETPVEGAEAISDLREQINRLEARFANMEVYGRSDDAHEQTTLTEADTGARGSHRTHLTSANTIPEVRKCTFAEFKNRFTEEDGRYALDVLVSGALLDQEIREEQKFRNRLFEHSKVGTKEFKTKASHIPRATSKTTKDYRKAQSGEVWNRRVRIQSPALLKILSKIQGESWSSSPRTYSRPFCPLIYFHPQMRKALGELEERWGSQRSSSPSVASSYTHDDAHHDEEPIDDCPAALAAMQCYVRFIDEEIMPDYEKFERMDRSSNAKLRFSDLCYLFRTGEHIYRPSEDEVTGSRLVGEVSGPRDYRMGERVWRLYHICEGDSQHLVVPSDHRRYDKQHADENSAAFTVKAYYLEFTGDEFCVVTKDFSIAPYEGFLPVASLPFFPMRFAPGSEDFLDDAVEIVDQLLYFIEHKHASYNGWTVMRTPEGGSVTDATGNVIKHPEHINSEVMVDFGEAFQACPSWKPKRAVLRQENSSELTAYDDFTIRWWDDKNRTKLLWETNETTLVKTCSHTWQRNKFVSEDAFLRAVKDNDNRGQLTTKQYLRHEEKFLLHPRVYAYILQERKFAQINSQKLIPAARTSDALDSLKIPWRTKELIQGSVRGHFVHKDAGRRVGADGTSLDVIQGKGTGLFILLHGVPGVGKTATAEAVAQANGKPLFKITCGDLGLAPDQVESSLRGIFRLAGIWDCILLMDEVDTFFSQRSKGDAAMTKNALVSVFLRVLDYYTGILFLTTNRAGALDEAFKSRIHYKIYYPPLSRNQTLEIWQLNIHRLRQMENDKPKEGQIAMEISEAELLRFAAAQFDSNFRNAGRWNGRQIRNAFQVARSLAYYDAQKEADRLKEIGSRYFVPVARLDVKHFELMHDIEESFGQYMKEVFSGQNDGDLALESEQRADHFAVPPYDQYASHHDESYNARSRFDGGSGGGGSSRGPTGRPRSDSRRTSGPTLEIPSATSRYVQHSRGSSFMAGHEEMAESGRGLPHFQDHSPQSAAAPRRQSQSFRGSPPFEGDHFRRPSPNASPRFPHSYNASEYMSMSREPLTSPSDRELHRQGEVETDSAYRLSRADPTRRENVGAERSQFLHDI